MGIGLEMEEIIKYFLMLIVLYVSGSLILRYMHIPGRMIAIILSNSLIGLAFLILINALTVSFGISLPINPFNLIFSALFGLPGVICLFIISTML